MKQELQRIKIAEACGWRRNGTIGQSRYPAWSHSDGRRVTLVNLPRYLYDLNAMHDAEKVLTLEHEVDFYNTIAGIVQRGCDRTPPNLSFLILHATASQRCEAFLRTLGLWEEGE